MSHRKVNSQGSIPFSWEDSPGVSKLTMIHPVPIDVDLHGVGVISAPQLPKSPSSRRVFESFPQVSSEEEKRIPLPPCPKPQAPCRSSSLKGFKWWQEDPFFAAYKECTKNVKSRKLTGENKTRTVVSKTKKGKLSFSCKNSCDVQENNMVRLPNLPPIPSGRLRGR
ncbi:hypothetical protein K2173_014716 [Erythroxylum novogranatense]|uniref:Uncharacterized protein n=1 Tax=Erythroxylum novogranatense TaxID=1862640 RepID=A0AAV8THA8_9ROSI|nr:hypothetical protein K2173_014716 [Erythroxylum novogranatense]